MNAEDTEIILDTNKVGRPKEVQDGVYGHYYISSDIKDRIEITAKQSNINTSQLVRKIFGLYFLEGKFAENLTKEVLESRKEIRSLEKEIKTLQSKIDHQTLLIEKLGTKNIKNKLPDGEYELAINEAVERIRAVKIMDDYTRDMIIATNLDILKKKGIDISKKELMEYVG